jgi:predicted DNA-binding protein (UPF0251 family)
MSGSKGRPKKIRYIQKMPVIMQFSPRGRAGRPDEVEITLDEFEALKLADYQELSQTQGANAMHVSRPSFGRMLRIARKKVADALVSGKTIKIKMGAQVGVTKKEITADILIQQAREWQKINDKVIQQAEEMASRRKATSHSGAT